MNLYLTEYSHENGIDFPAIVVCFDGRKMTEPESIKIFNNSMVRCEFNNIK